MDLTIIPEKGTMSNVDYLNALNQQLGLLTTAYTQSLAAKAAGDARYKDWTSGKTVDWNFVTNVINPANAVIAADVNKYANAIATIKSVISNVTDAANIEKSAAAAAVAQANATAAVTDAKSKLTPEQLYELQQAQIKADADAAAASKANADLASSANKKYLIYAIIAVVLIAVVAIIMKNSSK